MPRIQYKRGGREKDVADRYAKILVRSGIASYMTREMRAADPQPSVPQQFTPDVDSEGQQWNPEMHTSNRQMTKDGRWRRKPGASK